MEVMMKTKTFLVLNQKGGVGKTTLCINLAMAMKNLGQNTAIIDTDPQGTSEVWYVESTDKKKFFDVYINDGKIKSSEIDMLKKDIVFIDTPPRLNANNQTLVELSDYIIVPSAPTNFDLWATKNTIDFLYERKKDAKIIVIINNINQNRSELEFDLKEVLSNLYKDIYICENMIYRRNAYILEPNITIFERKNDKAKRELLNLANEILSYTNKILGK
jgi:chromosome partitioning protein